MKVPKLVLKKLIERFALSGPEEKIASIVRSTLRLPRSHWINVQDEHKGFHREGQAFSVINRDDLGSVERKTGIPVQQSKKLLKSAFENAGYIAQWSWIDGTLNVFVAGSIRESKNQKQEQEMKLTESSLRRLVRQIIKERSYPTEDSRWVTDPDHRSRQRSDLPTDPDWRSGYADGGAGDPPADEDNDQYMNGFAAGRRGMMR